jgi:hypothetical protein
MAQANTRSSSKQKRPTQRSNGSGATKRASASGSKSARAGSRAKNASGTASASSRRASAASTRATPAASSDNGATSKLPIIAGLATGAAGLIGGAVLGKRLASGKPKRVLGIQVPGTGNGMDALAKQVGKAAKQFKKASKQVGELTDEVRAAREKAEEVGRAFS